MNGDDPRPVPLLGDISLQIVQRMQHAFEAGFIPTRIAGLPGELQQRAGRPSHQIYLQGLLIGHEASSELETLQLAAEEGEELTFSADITSALDLQRVVITSFQAQEVAGQPDRIRYAIRLAESPPLPPPAQVEGFGGLDDFGLGDLGFDTDLLDELQDLAGDITGAIDDALDVIDQLGALANLDGLELGAFLEPMEDRISEVGGIASRLGEAMGGLMGAFSG